MDEETATRQATELLPVAEEVLKILRVGARRAFLVEVTGTPKAGKTSTLNLVHGFFKRAGYRVYTLRERAADCPIPMKGHFFFNAWTTCTMLSEVLATYDTDVDLIILDRGFFDALIWLGLQKQRGQVDEEETNVFTKFVLLERWRSLVDLTVLMTAEPATAMARESHGVLVPRQGSLMNEPALRAFNEQARTAAADHSGAFNVLQFDTTSTTNAKATAVRLLEELLPRIRTWGEQRIVVIPRDAVRDVFLVTGDGGPHRKTFLYGSAAETTWQKLQSVMSIRLRHEVERDDSLVQIVGCGILVHGDSLFLLTRTAKDEKAAYGRSTLWKGCHVEGEVPATIEGVSEQVKARVLEEFHLRTTLRLDLLGLAWTEEAGTESRHLGVLYQARIEDDAVAKSMQDKEFRKAGRGHVLLGKFQTPKDIIKALPDLDLEPWSKFAVENLGLQEPS